VSVAAIPSLHQSPIRIKVDGIFRLVKWRDSISPLDQPPRIIARPLSPCRGPRKSSVPCRVQVFLLKPYGFDPTLRWLTAWAVKVPEANFLGGTGFQSDLMVIPTPTLVHRSSQLLCKKLLRIKSYAIFHHVVGRPGQFVRQGSLGHHELSLRCFSIVIGPRIRIIASRKFCSL
jgi:hypothetical protein